MEKDISQKLGGRSLLASPITSSTTTNSAVVDTQGIQTGLAFYIGANLYTDGTYAFSFQQADNLAFSTNVTTIDSAQIVGSITDITAATTAGDSLQKVGILNLKTAALQDSRFVRVVVTSTSVTTGATIVVLATEMLDDAPAT